MSVIGVSFFDPTRPNDALLPDDMDDLAREIHYLCVAAELAERLLAELECRRNDDAVLDHDLTIYGPAITTRLGILQRAVSECSTAADDSGKLRWIERARAIIGPLGGQLGVIAQYVELRHSRSTQDKMLERDTTSGWMACPDG